MDILTIVALYLISLTTFREKEFPHAPVTPISPYQIKIPLKYRYHF